jgi:chromosome segregation ATPase
MRDTCEVCGKPEPVHTSQWTEDYCLSLVTDDGIRACYRLGYERQKARAEALEARVTDLLVGIDDAKWLAEDRDRQLVPLETKLDAAETRASRLEEALRELVAKLAAFSWSEEDLEQARAALRGEEKKP